MATKKIENSTLTKKDFERGLFELSHKIIGFGQDSEQFVARNHQEVMKNMQECTNRIMFVLNKISALVAEPKIPAPIDNHLHVDVNPTPVEIDTKTIIKISVISGAMAAVCTGGLVALIMGLLG